MAPRISKSSQELIEKFNFEFAEPPDKTVTRGSKYDEMWKAARALCEQNPGKSLRVREYNTGASAYNDAKSINNGEHRFFKDGSHWTAVAAKQLDDEGNIVYGEDGKEPRFDIYLSYTGPVPSDQ